jgi:hypothetical protein
MTYAKLLSAIAPVIMYQRRRFRGGEGAPGTPRYELGLQQKEDVLHRLVEVWATGEASASLGFAAARLFDELDPLEKKKNQRMAAQSLTGRNSAPSPPRTGTASGWKRSKPIRSSNSPCSMPRRTFFALPANSGTPGMART